MMKAADARLGLDPALCGQAALYQPAGRCGLFQSNVRSVFLIICKILAPKPSKMAFIQRDDVIKQLATSTADPSFSDSVLPRAP